MELQGKNSENHSKLCPDENIGVAKSSHLIRLTEKIIYSIYYVLWCMLVVWQAINSSGFWIVLHLFCVGVANWCI